MIAHQARLVMELPCGEFEHNVSEGGAFRCTLQGHASIVRKNHRMMSNVLGILDLAS